MTSQKVLHHTVHQVLVTQLYGVGGTKALGMCVHLAPISFSSSARCMAVGRSVHEPWCYLVFLYVVAGVSLVTCFSGRAVATS